MLDETDIDVDHVNRLGWTALLEAVILGDGGPRHAEVVATLLAAGADPVLADHDGVTPYEHAARRGFDGIARILRTAEAGGKGVAGEAAGTGGMGKAGKAGEAGGAAEAGREAGR